ncbi:hypothetical protein PEL8287_00278 [Roseovarius litorisediminis]|uniref:Lipoprotein n=1 Tax=Roseovarius litorisediminis TaxID=1312363 RepID=A0A1Y5R8K5_9RHOB|nr:hypothetical protein [Roseovarius litorisediminis]SLN11679.1 hypothetical protein PEL8287_00278 [Roseovarius litorisediminis]
MTHLRQLCLSAFIFLTACTVSLLPDYDQKLHQGLNDANKDAHILFSALSGGSSKAQFSKHAAQYHKVIGSFGALLTRAKTRPQPDGAQKISSKFRKLPKLGEICAEVEADQGCAIVTPRAINEIIETLSKMRDRHKTRGLPDGLLTLLVADYEISIEQALTVEAALQ